MKRGIIRISKSIYDEYWTSVANLFKEFKPYHIEYSVWENEVWRFHGTSDRFESIKEGDPIPFYKVEFDVKNNKFTFSKIT